MEAEAVCIEGRVEGGDGLPARGSAVGSNTCHGNFHGGLPAGPSVGAFGPEPYRERASAGKRRPEAEEGRPDEQGTADACSVHASILHRA